RPIAGKGLPDARQVARRARQRRSVDLDVIETNRGVDVHGPRVRLLPDHLPVQLRLRRDINDEVAQDQRVTSKSTLWSQPAAAAVEALRFAEGRKVIRARIDPELRVMTFRDLKLAATTDPPPAAN